MVSLFDIKHQTTTKQHKKMSFHTTPTTINPAKSLSKSMLQHRRSISSYTTPPTSTSCHLSTGSASGILLSIDTTKSTSNITNYTSTSAIANLTQKGGEAAASFSSSSSLIVSPQKKLSFNHQLPVSLLVNQNLDPKSSTKLNEKFHALFPSVPHDEYVIETYSCAYVKSVNLLQGLMFLTKNFICFYSKILTHETILIIRFNHINSITKSMLVLIFPTQIRIETRNSVYSFTSFRSRANTLDHLSNLLLQSRQREADLINVAHTNMVDEDDEDQLLNKTIELDSNDVKVTIDDDEPRVVRSNSINILETNKEIKENQFLIDKRNSIDNSRLQASTRNENQFLDNNNNFIYDIKFNSTNTVTVSLRSKRTLSQKIQLLLAVIIPGFFDISRIEALLPICFIMCVLLLLNAFVLLNKVNQVDDLFSKILS